MPLSHPSTAVPTAQLHGGVQVHNGIDSGFIMPGGADYVGDEVDNLANCEYERKDGGACVAQPIQGKNYCLGHSRKGAKAEAQLGEA